MKFFAKKRYFLFFRAGIFLFTLVLLLFVALIAIRRTQYLPTPAADGEADASAESSSETIGTASLPDIRPNIIYILTDDASFETLTPDAIRKFFPNIQKYILEKGMYFSKYFVSTSQCCPSRGAFMRGQYAHNTGLYTNNNGNNEVEGMDGTVGGFDVFYSKGYVNDEVGTRMKEAGYTTALMGKYLHDGFPQNAPDTIRFHPAGWDDFFYTGTGSYYNFYVVKNGKRTVYNNGEYRTDIESQQASQYISDHVQGKPFLLYLAPYSPHVSTSTSLMYPTRYANSYAGEQLLKTPNFNEDDVSDKSSFVSGLQKLDESSLTELYRNRLRSMKTIDDMVGQIFTTLQEKGLLDKTYIFLSSDNGMLVGNHRMENKGLPYLESYNVPLYVVGPGVPNGYREHLVMNIDLLSTFLDFAKLPSPPYVDGKSFKNLLVNPIPVKNWRTQVLHQYHPTDIGGNQTITFQNYTYIFWESPLVKNNKEFYNIRKDPYQLNNIYSTLSKETKDFLESVRLKMSSCAKTSCNELIDTSPYFDDQEPQISFDRSSSSSLIEGSHTIMGTIHDVSGIGRIKIRIYNTQDAKFWDGSAWSTKPTYISIPSQKVTDTQSLWSYTFPAKSKTSYQILVVALDRNGVRNDPSTENTLTLKFP